MKQPVNILIVDDEPKNLAVLETILDDPSYRLVRAESADQALLALVNDDFSLLILDVRMPDLSGFELAKLIKERKKTAGVPIIFLTAFFNEDQHVLAGYDTGAVDYLHKPVNVAILRSKVAAFVELYRKSREWEMANRALVVEVSERRRAEEQLRELNQTLEQRVAERTEALRNSDRRKDEFLAILAHELRNPLAPIRNAVQFLKMKGAAFPELRWVSDIIDRQMQAMARLIDDLMDLGRINQGKIALQRERIALDQVLQVAIETSRPLIEEMDHELVVAMSAIPVMVDADPIRLSQVFLNLLNNAAKYMERGGRIDLRVEALATEVVVSVKDAGIGIPIDRLPSIFEMFSQVEAAFSRSRGGLGIGLCLVKRLVELHGGSVEAHSEGAGKGSEFLVRMPIVVENTYAHKRIGNDDETLTSDLRILVVDDNRDAASSIGVLLEMMGNKIRIAHEGEEAIHIAREFRPHVILCDIGLPKMNGYEVCRRVRQELWGENVVIIAVTGWGQEDDKRKSEDAGFDRHMVKPVQPQVLMKLLSDAQIVKS